MQNEVTSASGGKKGCWVALLIVIGILLVVGLLGWFVLRPWLVKKFCENATRNMLENSWVKWSESDYYNACLKKFWVEK